MKSLKNLSKKTLITIALSGIVIISGVTVLTYNHYQKIELETAMKKQARIEELKKEVKELIKDSLENQDVLDESTLNSLKLAQNSLEYRLENEDIALIEEGITNYKQVLANTENTIKETLKIKEEEHQKELARIEEEKRKQKKNKQNKH